MNQNGIAVGVMMPADMGSAVAARLLRHRHRVLANVNGRSDRTRSLAAAVGVEVVGDDAALVAACDVILSIVTPSAAIELAHRLAPAIREAGRPVIFADCNAIAPNAAREAAGIIEAAGGRFVDAGIIGPPPRQSRDQTRFYASGPTAQELADVLGDCLDMRLVSRNIGDASALKMCYAALTKGSAALMTQLLVAAERLGVGEPLRQEFGLSQPQLLARMHQVVPAAVPKAFRWVAEMEEIARTFSAAGITPRGFEGAAAIFDSVASTPLGRIRVEEWAGVGLGFDEVVRRLAAEMEKEP